MEDFESFVKRKIVKKSFQDIQRAKKLVKDGRERLIDVELLNLKRMPKFVFENTYDAIRDFLLAILLKDGYKTNSHEATISYLLNKNFDIYIVTKLDQFRYKRNGSKYYGEEVSVQEAEGILAFYKQIKSRIDKLIKDSQLE